MITPQELRIGNYINFNDGSCHDDIRKIVGISTKDINTVVKGCHFATAIRSNNLIYPIPLTEEILLKCNATLHGIEYIIKASALPFKFRFHSGIAYCEMGNVYLGDRIQYLHQLQNLYNLLTGKELEIKL